jgi:hypothetical protein
MRQVDLAIKASLGLAGLWRTGGARRDRIKAETNLANQAGSILSRPSLLAANPMLLLQ